MDGDNGRVTLAVVLNEVKHITANMEELKGLMRETCESVAEHSVDIKLLKQADEKRTKDLDILRSRDLWGALAAGILAAGAGIVAIFKP